jgi:flagellar hook-length control protein FliK
MISSVNFNPAVVFTAPPAPRRDTARDEAPTDSGAQDAFERMLTQQRDTARQASKLANPTPVPTQAPAPEQPPMQVPEPTAGTPPTASETAAPTGRPVTPPAGATAKRPDETAAEANAKAKSETEGRPAQLDPVESGATDRHAYHTKLLEMTRQAKLAQMTSKQGPVRLPPLGPEDQPEGIPRCPPGMDPAEHEMSDPALPPIECPVEPVMALTVPPVATKATGAGGADRPATQDLQAATADSRQAPASATSLPVVDDRAMAGAVAAALSTASAEPVPAAAAAVAVAETVPRTERTDLGGALAPALAAPGGTSASVSAPAARQATLDARPGTEAFASKFSAQVAVWVREGVHEAQLQLNPADMGPVRVAILLEGAAAQVNFTAEHALTRQALEQALPTLAGSLAEAGFTLAGGGVFDQARQSERDTADTARNPGSGAGTQTTETGPDAQRATVARPRGVVDLVA